MSAAIDVELEAVQLQIFQPKSFPSREYRQPQYLSIHQVDSVLLRLNASRGTPYLLTTLGELCFPINYHPTKVSAAGDLFFNEKKQIKGISNDSEHYNTAFDSIFPVLWLLRYHGFELAPQVELLREDEPSTIFVSRDTLEVALDKLSEDLTDLLALANKPHELLFQEFAEDDTDDFIPPSSFSAQDRFSRKAWGKSSEYARLGLTGPKKERPQKRRSLSTNSCR